MTYSAMTAEGKPIWEWDVYIRGEEYAQNMAREDAYQYQRDTGFLPNICYRTDDGGWHRWEVWT